MTSGWPPSPSVEDEELALAREHAFATIAPPTQTKEETPARGTVDQYPIILDINQQPSRNDTSAIESDKEQSSSDESHGPPTPTAANSEQRFVLLEHETSQKILPERPREIPRPKSTSNLKSEDCPRGRPYLPPIHTGVSTNLDEIVTGRQRPLSPYPSNSKQHLGGSYAQKRFSGELFRSPQYAPSDDYFRERSTGPRGNHDDAKSMTDYERTSEKRRHHSRRRRESGIRTERPSLEKLVPAAFDKRSVSYTTATPISSILSSGLTKHIKNDSNEANNSRQTRPLRDSPYSSSAEEKTKRHISKSRRRSRSRPRMERKTIYDSPYTSSAEESNNRTHRAYKVPTADGKLSRRSSMTKKERNPLDISEQHYPYGGGDQVPERLENSKRRSDPRHHPVFGGRTYLEPSSAQSPQAMEDYLAKAFQANSKRSAYTPRASPNASPFTSPPHSPPRTPRANRSSKDYFDFVSPGQSEAPSSRQPSGDDSSWSVSRPLTASTIAATGAAVSKAMPSLSRTSTAPIDTPSQGSTSKGSSSGQRSRRPSPVRADAPRPLSRANSIDMRDDRPLPRSSTTTSSEQRRPPRMPAIVTEIPPSSEYRPSSRGGGGSYVGFEHPPPIPRAYSAVTEEVPRPPSAYRALSSSQIFPTPFVERVRPAPTQRTAPSTFVTPTSATLSSASSFQSSRSTYFIPVPVDGPPAVVPNREPAPTNLPPCSRSTPVAGYHDWYTVNQVSDVNICPTCMTTLGSSRFKDIFVKSFSNPVTQIRCAMSLPWLRIAFVQLVKQRRTPQDMIKVFYDMSHLPEGTHICPGKTPDTRKWWQLIDPFDKSIVPGFEICTECVRSIDVIFPQLKCPFKRSSGLVQERVCNLSTQNKRFLGYIEQLDKAATRFDTEKLREPDIQDLAKYARRVATIQDCPRDNMMLSWEWHFMPDLPEFTICRECFEELVRPIHEKAVARDFSRKPRLLPTNQYVPAGAKSCQLYSARMRQVFQEAVRNNDPRALKLAAMQRHEAEIGCQARHRELKLDTSGRDRSLDVMKNIEVWKSWE